MKKNMVLTMAIAITSMLLTMGCGGEESSQARSAITPPAQSVIGTYRLTGFGLEQISTGDIVDDETNHEPWSGTMAIDEFEMVRWMTKDAKSWITRTWYLFEADGRFRAEGWMGTNGSYEFDGLFILLRWAVNEGGWGDVGWCYKYEFWEKVSD